MEFTLKLDGLAGIPLYQQLYLFIVGEIRSGGLPQGAKLPSKRGLSTHLQVSVSTVETAYSILSAEGYIKSKPKSGFFVCATSLPEEKVAAAATEVKAEEKKYSYSFSTGEVNTSVFPYASWAKITKEIVYQNPQLLQRGSPQGDIELREALRDFLHQYRGVVCDENQIIVGAGIEYLLDLLLQLFEKNKVVGFENPGYGTAIHTVRNNGCAVRFIGMDEDGMIPSELAKTEAWLAYVTPSHQFPTGVTMPVGRRGELLGWANAQDGRYIIEDDYDSEFRYNSRPIPAMQGLDKNGRVIYIGTFSRSIAPSIRVAYMVLPVQLLKVYSEKFYYSASTVSRFEQQTLARFIKDGLYGRHLRRASNIYRRRNGELTAFLRQIKGARVSGSDAGLHMLCRVEGKSEGFLVSAAKARGVYIHGLSEYFHGENCPDSTVVLGFAGMDEEKLKRACDALRFAWQL